MKLSHDVTCSETIFFYTQQEILDYLALFSDSVECQTGFRGAMHPADMVVEAFKDAAAAAETLGKMRTFLEEALKVHGMKLDAAMPPEPCAHYSMFLFFLFC